MTLIRLILKKPLLNTGSNESQGVEKDFSLFLKANFCNFALVPSLLTAFCFYLPFLSFQLTNTNRVQK